MAQETQDFIDEMLNPTVQAHAQMSSWIKGSLVVLRDADQQVARLRGLLQEAEDAEPDSALEGKMDGVISQLKVHQTVYADAAALLRRLRTSRKILKEQGDELLALAEPLGYTIP